LINRSGCPVQVVYLSQNTRQLPQLAPAEKTHLI
jgi:hypothetical protein